MTLAMKIVPRFPARVDGSGPITVTKENGVYKIAYDISGLAAFDLDDATTSFITIYDADTGTFGKLTIQALIDEIGTNLDPVLTSLIDADDGIIVKNGNDVESREIAGTANEISVSNGDGVAGNPTVSLPSALTFTGKTVTGGTFSGPAISSPTGITKSDVGLGNVDNTSDVNKPVSTLQAEADDLRLPLAGGTMSGFITLHSDPSSAMHAVTKQYADGLVAAQDAMVFKGVIDCSANPNYPAANRGDTYRVSVDGKIGGASGANVENGDILICMTDASSAGDQATVGSNWAVIQSNIDGAVTLTGTQTLTNKTLTSPVINSPTGIVKGDVGLGNVDNTSDATKNAATATLSNKTINGASNTLLVREADLNLSDNTTNDASTTKHGLLPKLPGGTTSYLRADGAWATPAGGGGGGGDVSSDTATSAVNGVAVFRDGGGTLIGEPDGPVDIGFDPVSATDAATKQYVDNAIAAIPDPVAMAIVFGS